MVDFIPIFLRSLLYVATILAVGSILLANSFSVTRGDTLHVLLRKQLLLGICLLIAVELSRMVLIAFQFSDWVLSEALTVEMLELIFEISPGHAILTRLAGAIILVITACVLKSWKLSLFPAVLILAGYLQEGHTASMEIETNLIWVFKFALFVHLAVFHWWLAALYPLKKMVKCQDKKAHSTAEKFGNQAIMSVPCLLIAGFVLLGALLNIPNLSASEILELRSDPYTQIFVIKLILVGGLLLIAACNKLWLTSALIGNQIDAYSKFSKVLGFESLVGIGVLIATASAIYVGMSY